MSGVIVPGAALAGGVLGAQATGALPFTGLVLSVFVVLGLALVLSGLLLRLTGSRRQ